MNTVKRTRGDKEDMFDDYSGGVEDFAVDIGNVVFNSDYDALLRNIL